MKKEIITLKDERYRLGYHVSAPSGWINDPNGFCYFKGYYHIFYQYHPYSAEWGPMHWGHARSKDLVNWESLPTALIPGDKEDKDGCFSGSAIVKDDVMYLFYTGHHYYGDNDPDHFWQNQNMAYSADGIHFEKYENNPIIAKEPEGNTHHFRDPKVWEHDGTYYMVLGSQNKDGVGRAIIYTSSDLLNWEYQGPMATAQGLTTEGFMWECPDYFNLDGKDILLLSPQGIASEEKKYLNLFQTGYFMGDYDYQSNQLNHDGFKELDKGHDFYATQTTLAPDGRRLVFGWMAMWESDMPEKEDGWAGALTLPRELRVKNNHLYMIPVKELESLRMDNGIRNSSNESGEILLAKNLEANELLIDCDLSELENQEIIFSLQDSNKQSIIELKYNQRDNELVLKRDTSEDMRYATITPSKKLSLHIFVDKSSIEIFINKGELVFTERYYASDDVSAFIETDGTMSISSTIYTLTNQAITYS